MKIHLIRNATMRFQYAGHTFVTDPYLAAKHSRPTYTGKSPNPLVELPIPAEQVLAGIEFAVISHLHSDHFDPAAQEALAKDTPIFCQPGDAEKLNQGGFSDVTPVIGSVHRNGLTITCTGGQHGSGAVLQEMGGVSGFVFQSKDEPTVYWAGDTIWCPAVADAIARSKPDIIITHSGGAVWGDNVLILMDAVQTMEVCRVAPHSTVVAIHMEALDHCTVTRQDLREYANAHGVRPGRLLIPADGEMLDF